MDITKADDNINYIQVQLLMNTIHTLANRGNSTINVVPLSRPSDEYRIDPRCIDIIF